MADGGMFVWSVFLIASSLVFLVANRNWGQVLVDHPSLLVGMLVAALVGMLWI